MPFLLCLAVLFLLAPINPPITRDNAAQVQVLTRIEAAGSDPRALAFNPLDSRQLAVAQGNGLVTVWDVTDGSLLYRWPVAETAVNGVAYLPDGRLVTIADNGSVLVQDIVTGETLRDWTILGEIPVVLDTDAQNRVAIGYRDGTTRLWDATSGKHLLTLYGYHNPVVALDLVPTGSEIAFGYEAGTVLIYRLEDIERQRVYLDAIHDDPVLIHGTSLIDLALCLDLDQHEFMSGLGLITIGKWQSIRLRDAVYSPQIMGEWQANSDMAIPTDLALNSDGTLFAVGGIEISGACSEEYPCPIELIHARFQNGGYNVLKTLEGNHHGWISDVAFSSDSRYLASASTDGLLLIWGVPAG